MSETDSKNTAPKLLAYDEALFTRFAHCLIGIEIVRRVGGDEVKTVLHLVAPDSPSNSLVSKG